MKNISIVFSALFSTFLIASEPQMVWDSQNGLGEWKALRNVKTVYEDGVIKLSGIERDPQVVSPKLNLDASAYNRVSITYRGWDIPSLTQGQIYFAHENGRFNAFDFWQIPPLAGDGQWHTEVLDTKAIRNPQSWTMGGPVSRLRLDPYDAPGGRFEIREIKFFHVPGDAAVETKVTKPAARPAAAAPVSKPAAGPAAAAPAVKPAAASSGKKKAAASRSTAPLDEGEWPDVVPEFKDFPRLDPYERYFQGKMIKCPADKGDRFLDAAHKVYYLRREFTLREKPVTAWVQFNADDDAVVWINGQQAASCDNWRVASSAEVSAYLKKGDNVWGIRYRNGYGAGGTMGELYIEYADGSFERIHTDESFVSTNEQIPDWSKPGKVAGSWEKVIALPGAPNPPWIEHLSYKDFSSPQKFLKAEAAPAKAVAGDTVKLVFSFEGRIPQLPFSSEIVLYRNGEIGWNEPLLITEKNIRKEDGTRWSLVLDYELPLYFNTCDVTLRLESASLFCLSGGYPQTAVSIQRRDHVPGYEKAPVAVVKELNGSPCFELNGKPFYPVWGSVNAKIRPDRVPRFGDAELNTVTVITDVGKWFPAVGQFDPAEFDRQAESYRRQMKDAWFIWSLSIYLPNDWAEKYKTEICVDDKGQISRDGKPNYTFASEQARKDLKEAVERAIRYLESSPYANRIIGYRIGGGHTIEWLGWDPKPGRTLDFSPAAQKAFKEFAAKNYPELESPHIPSLEERTNTGDQLWDQRENLNVVAFNDFYSQSVVDMMIPVMRSAKELVKNRKLIGTYYGYTATLHSTGFSQLRAHYALKKLLDAKCVDFLLSPQGYSIRRIGDTAGDMKPFRTIQDNNIVPVIENDARTHNGRYLDRSNCHQTLTEAQTVAVMRRDMGIALCRSMPSYYLALMLGTEFDFPAMKTEIETIRKVGEYTLGKARRQAEIAYVISEETIKSMPGLTKGARTGESIQTYDRNGKVKVAGVGSRVITGESFGGNITRLARLGAPVDYLLAEDLCKTKKTYKLYIFINSFKYDEAFLKKIEELRQTPCTMLWVYAPGYAKGPVNSLDNMKELTGFDFQLAPGPVLPRITLNDGSMIGTPSTPISPMFSVKPGPDVTALGLYKDGTIGLAKKTVGQSTSIFCGVVQFTVPFLTSLAETAGVHIYQKNGDPMEANSHLFTLHARFAGKKTVTLPEKTTVLDVFNRKIVGRDIDKFEFEAPLHSSWLFYYGSDADELLKKLEE